MEKVPRFLWWLLGGVAVFDAGVLVDVISPSHGQNQPAVKMDKPLLTKAASPVVITAPTKPAKPGKVVPLISNLPLPAQSLLKNMPAVPAFSCINSFSEAMDKITGHKQLMGSGEYTGVITVTNGPNRSHYVNWKVHILPAGVLACSGGQLIDIMSHSSYYLKINPVGKCANTGWITLQFKVSHNDAIVSYPVLPDGLSDFGRNVGNRLMLAIKAAYHNCR